MPLIDVPANSSGHCCGGPCAGRRLAQPPNMIARICAQQPLQEMIMLSESLETLSKLPSEGVFSASKGMNVPALLMCNQSTNLQTKQATESTAGHARQDQICTGFLTCKYGLYLEGGHEVQHGLSQADEV